MLEYIRIKAKDLLSDDSLRIQTICPDACPTVLDEVASQLGLVSGCYHYPCKSSSDITVFQSPGYSAAKVDTNVFHPLCLAGIAHADIGKCRGSSLSGGILNIDRRGASSYRVVVHQHSTQI